MKIRGVTDGLFFDRYFNRKNPSSVSFQDERVIRVSDHMSVFCEFIEVCMYYKRDMHVYNEMLKIAPGKPSMLAAYCEQRAKELGSFRRAQFDIYMTVMCTMLRNGKHYRIWWHTFCSFIQHIIKTQKTDDEDETVLVYDRVMRCLMDFCQRDDTPSFMRRMPIYARVSLHGLLHVITHMPRTTGLRLMAQTLEITQSCGLLRAHIVMRIRFSTPHKFMRYGTIDAIVNDCVRYKLSKTTNTFVGAHTIKHTKLDRLQLDSGRQIHLRSTQMSLADKLEGLLVRRGRGVVDAKMRIWHNKIVKYCYEFIRKDTVVMRMVQVRPMSLVRAALERLLETAEGYAQLTGLGGQMSFPTDWHRIIDDHEKMQNERAINHANTILHMLYQHQMKRRPC